MEDSMIFEDDVATYQHAMGDEALKLRHQNEALKKHNQLLRDKIKELEVSLEQEVGPKYASMV
tara:strand:+ start:375 stop:563 length:189 start_codon:yes stop_codon:yes gene_type:complete